jgi:hypothetical protein
MSGAYVDSFGASRGSAVAIERRRAVSSGVRRRRRNVQRRDPDGTVVLVRDDAELASWPIGSPCRPDLDLVDQLARCALAARRLGCSIRLRDACTALLELLDLAGLRGMVEVATAGASGQVIGQTQGGEERGVDEVVVPDDPVA